MLRARQTADIIAGVLGTEVSDYDGILNEGTPCIHHPGGVDIDSGSKLSRLLQDAPRLEAAFNKFVHRKTNLKKAEQAIKKKSKEAEKIDEAFTGTGKNKDEDSKDSNGSGGEDGEKKKKKTQEVVHEYEVVVCHMNVIRYFVCRALQLPPEAWLRFRGDNCGLTEIIVYDEGRVSLGRFADQGHLTIEETTFH